MGVITLVSSSGSRVSGHRMSAWPKSLHSERLYPSRTPGSFLKPNAPSRPARTCWRLCRTISRILYQRIELAGPSTSRLRSGLMQTRCRNSLIRFSVRPIKWKF